MSRHVVLITDAHEAPAYELIEALRAAGLKTLIEGLREVEIEVELARQRESTGPAESLGPPPLAVLYEVVPGADMVELHTAVEHAKAFWPGAPLIACRRHVNGYQSHNLRSLDGNALKRLGFRAIADKAAQLSAILREIEGHGVTGELRLPEILQKPAEPASRSLPAKLKSSNLRAAFDLVSSLHFIADQNGAAHTALAGLELLVQADRWVVYLVSDGETGDGTSIEAIAMRKPGEEIAERSEEDWRLVLTGESVLPAGSESKASKLAASGMSVTKRKEHGQRIVAIPLICGERLLGVLEALREGKDARSFNKSEVALLESLALPIASALANAVRIAEAERLSQTDDLTKLHNARYLRQFLLNEIRRARRYGSSVAALFLDLDDFKQINDLHGHLVGSHVLMEMAAVILSSVRDTDAVARYGGDEFVIVLPDTGIPQQLISCADTAMYEAKAADKNCVRFTTALGQGRTETRSEAGATVNDKEQALSQTDNTVNTKV